MIGFNNRLSRYHGAIYDGRQAEFITGQGDWMLSVGPVCMTLFGIVMVYSASLFIASQQGVSQSHFLVRQAIVTVIGVGVLLAGMFIEPQYYRKWIYHAVVAITVVMLYQLFFAPPIKGTHRWLVLPGGFMLQTSEVVRMVAIVYTARVISDDVQIGRQVSKRLLLFALPIIFLAAITYLQKDLSGAGMIAAMAGLILFLGGFKSSQLWIAAAIGAGILLLSAFLTPYQWQRLIGFYFPTGSETGDLYQTHQSMIGFGCGGVFGVGLGDGQQKMLFLPECHTDFIYSVVGEEIGLFGSIAVLVAFLFLFYRSIRVLKQQSERFNFLVGSGLIASILMFALVHMAVTTGLVPVTGLPLPFISNGGSSLLVSLWSMGFIWNLSRRTSRFE